MEQSTADSELYIFRTDATAAAGATTQVDFFVDPSLTVTEAVTGWLDLQKKAWRRRNTALNYSIPLVISGPPKVRPDPESTQRTMLQNFVVVSKPCC